jgi:hypothetical protein
MDLLLASVRTPPNLITGGTTAFAAARAACCAERETIEQSNRSQTPTYNLVRNIEFSFYSFLILVPIQQSSNDAAGTWSERILLQSDLGGNSRKLTFLLNFP